MLVNLHLNMDTENDAMSSSSTAVFVSWAHISLLAFPPLCWAKALHTPAILGLELQGFP